MPKVELLCGMICSGKSTYAKRRAKEGAIVVSHDDLSQMCHQEYRYQLDLRSMYRAMEESLVGIAVQNGKDVVIDRTHLTKEARSRWRNAFIGDLHVVDFKLELPQVHARRRFEADARGRPYDEWLKVAIHHYDQAKAEPLCWKDEGFSSWKLVDNGVVILQSDQTK